MFVDVPELIIESLRIFVLISTFELLIVLFKGIVDQINLRPFELISFEVFVIGLLIFLLVLFDKLLFRLFRLL